MPEYWRADEPEQIAQTFLKYHPDLIGAAVSFVFKEKATLSDGNPIIGKAFRVPAKYQPLMETLPNGDQGYDFIIVVGFDAWSELNNANKSAWIDHLLEHCYGEEDKNGDMKWKLRRPSVQAFPVILQRHGTGWDQGVNKLSVIDLKQEATATNPTVRTPEATNVATQFNN